MSRIEISSNGWLAISIRSGSVGLFHVSEGAPWQYHEIESNDEELHRNLIQFSPNGQFFVLSGPNKQLNIYTQTDFLWILRQKVSVQSSIVALELTNQHLFLADINGNIYQIDLFSKNVNHVLSDNWILQTSSTVLDLLFLENENHSFLITTDQENRICLHNYPNTSQTENYCLGHTELISHLKLIDNHHLLSASGDGTIRLWHLPDCKPLVLLHSKVFSLHTKEIFYTELYVMNPDQTFEAYRNDAMPNESPVNSSSIIDSSIWKFDVTSSVENTFLAFSICAQRFHSIYLTSLENLKDLANKQRKLIFDISYGTILDYSLQEKDGDIYLYVLFDTRILLKININSILLTKNNEYAVVQSDENIVEINQILTQKQFQSSDQSLMFEVNFYKQFFQLEENLSQKRKIDEHEHQQQKKSSSSINDEHLVFDK